MIYKHTTMKKTEFKNIIKEEVQNYFLNEVKAIQISVNDEYTLAGDIGKFKKGEVVTVVSLKPYGNDLELTLSNGKTKDTFYLDRNDDFEALTEEEEPTNPQKNIDRETAKTLIKNTKGKFFTVTFIKKDGTTRVMNARLGVKAYLRGGSLPYDPEPKGLLPVFDVKTGDYRMININTITNLKIGKDVYNVG